MFLTATSPDRTLQGTVAVPRTLLRRSRGCHSCSTSLRVPLHQHWKDLPHVPLWSCVHTLLSTWELSTGQRFTHAPASRSSRLVVCWWRIIRAIQRMGGYYHRTQQTGQAERLIKCAQRTILQHDPRKGKRTRQAVMTCCGTVKDRVSLPI